MMYFKTMLFFVLFFAYTDLLSQIIYLQDPSFELGTTATQITPLPPWSNCSSGMTNFGSVDHLDGLTVAYCTVAPTDGNKYVGMVAAGWQNRGGPGLTEWISQQLSQPLQAGIEYHISLDIGSSSTYNAYPCCSGTPTEHTGFPIYLQIRGMVDTCDNTVTELLWQSPTTIPSNNTFEKYDICFTPSNNNNAISFVSYSTSFSGYGNVLIDNLSPITQTAKYAISIDSATLDQANCNVTISGKTSIAPISILLSGGFINSPLIPTINNDSIWSATISYEPNTLSDSLTISGTFPCIGTTLTDYTNINLCTKSIDTTTPLSPPISNIYIPNAFSPNGDGINDVLEVKQLNVESLEFKIFDKWGNLVVKSNDINYQWNGNNSKGVPSNQGVYVYVITGNYFDNEEINLKGNITLIR